MKNIFVAILVFAFQNAGFCQSKILKQTAIVPSHP
jgi:hypothetical protein